MFDRITKRMATFINYFGKTKVNDARQPKSDLLADGAANGILGPIEMLTICVPSFVTADILGLRNAVVVLAIQFCVISELIPTPAPLFQLYTKKG